MAEKVKKPTKKEAQGEVAEAQGEVTAAQLMAALSYMTDVIPTGSRWHSWRTALVAERLASIVAPGLERDVFYAGLLHEIGSVGAYKHITRYVSLREQIDDINVRGHSQRGAALLNWLPGMKVVASYVRSHHEWWDGRGFPDQIGADLIPKGASIISIVTAADMAGCFATKRGMKDCLRILAPMVGFAWPQELWAAFVRSVSDSDFYGAIAEPDLLPEMIANKINELPLPIDLQDESGSERVLHVIAAVVDIKDPSTNGHSLRTARRACALASFMRLSDADVKLAYQAGLVHDCGRLGVDTYILNKAGKLSDKEMEIVRRHAKMTLSSFECLPDCPEMKALGNVAGRDHEWFDGRGYPGGLAGEDIPLVSRIISVVDAYDAMVAAASYRLLTPKGAVVRIQQCADTQFDPKVVEALVDAVACGIIEESLDPSDMPADIIRITTREMESARR